MRPAIAPSPCFQSLPAARSAHRPIVGVKPIQQARRSVVVAAKQQPLGTQIIGGAFGGANEIFVAGSESQLGARVVQKLLQSGFKVVAGVGDEERAQAAVDFAASVELLRKQELQKLRLEEFDLGDEESIAAALPKRGARVVAVVGDAPKGGTKLDARSITRLLAASQEVGASQFVLVTPSGSASGGGGFFGALFGGGGGSVGGSGSKPSKLEQDIASSGLDFIVVRTGRTDSQEAELDADSNVAVGAQGSLPPQSRISKSQVAEVVLQALRLADNDVLLEAWASPDSPAIQIEDAVREALPGATVAEEEQEEEAEEAAPPANEEEDIQEIKARRGGGGGFGGFGAGTQRVKVQAEEEEEEAPKPRGGFFGRGTQRVKVQQEEEEEEEAPKPKGLFGFGTKKVKVQEEEEEEEPKAKGGLFGFGTQKVKTDSPAATQSSRRVRGGGRATQNGTATPAKPKRGGFGFGKKAEEPEEEDVEYNPQGALKKLFGSKKPVEQAEVSVNKARRSASQGVKAAGRAAKKATPATRPGGDEKPKKSFLESIGLSTEKYSYADDD